MEPLPLLDLQQRKCSHMQRSLHGLKQSPRLWNNSINKVLHEIRFRRMSTDGCTYVKGTPNIGQPYIMDNLFKRYNNVLSVSYYSDLP